MTDGHCFISYSTADGLDFATKLSDELEGGHPFIKVWFDKRDLRSEENWDSQLAEAIKTCKCMFFIMSRDSVTENSVCAEEWDWAMRYKKPVVPLRLHSDIEVPFRLGRRQWIDFSGEFKVGIAKLRKYVEWLESPEGILQFLKYRLADAERDLRRARPEDQLRIQTEIDTLKAEIKADEVIQKDPEKAKKQTRKNINTGLERDRQPINPVDSKVSSKFINPRPGSVPDYFEGRFIETQEIADFLRNDFQRIMTINGRAGSGKTVLACRTLQHLESGQFPYDLGEFKVDGIIYLSEISNYKVNVANIFSGLLQLIEPQKAKRIEELYKEAKVPIDEKIRALLFALPAEPAILLLDNFEDLLSSDSEAILDRELHLALTALLHADSHRLKVIITTRMLPRQLNMIEPARQYIKHLEEGLPSPFAENVLRKMDKDGHAGFRDATDELLGRVREATLGYPRALESLYAILRVDRYSDVDELLVAGIPDTVVEKFVGEAFSRLDPTSQKVIQTLAIYNRPVSSAAVDFALQFHVPGINSAPILERLVSMHFVRREAKRYFLHPADQEYALSRLPQGNFDKKIGQGARARTWDQHSLTLRAADYFVEVRKPRTEWKKLGDLAAQLAEFDLRFAAGDYNTAANVLTNIDFDYLILWGHYHLLIELHLRVKDKITDQILRMYNLNALGVANNNIGKVSESIDYHRQGLDIAREQKNRGMESTFLGNLGNAYASWGEVSKVIEFHEQALVIDREIHDRRGEGTDLGNLGGAYATLGETSKAIEFYEKALAIARKNGDKGGESANLGNLGGAYGALGDIRKAMEFYEQALVIARKLGDRKNEGAFLCNFGIIYSSVGDVHKAIGFLEQALMIVRDIGERGGEAEYLSKLGGIYIDLDQLDKALEFYEQAQTISRETRNRMNKPVDLINLGTAFLERGDYQKAEENYKQAINIGDENSLRMEQLSGRWGLAQTLLLKNDLVNSRATIEAALQYDVPQNNHNVTALHGIIALRQGERETAREAFTKSVAQADEILAKTPDYYSALDAKGLAICGLAITTGDSHLKDDCHLRAIETFRKARKIAPHAGVVKSVLRLFDELVKCDEEEILKDVRKAAEGS